MKSNKSDNGYANPGPGPFKAETQGGYVHGEHTESMRLRIGGVVQEAALLTVEGTQPHVGQTGGFVNLIVRVKPVPPELVKLLEKVFDADANGDESPEVSKVLRLIHKLSVAKALADEIV